MSRVRSLAFALASAGAVLLVSCAALAPRAAAPAALAAPFPAARFAVLSDAHLYDTALGTEGAAFQEYMNNDRKLLPQTEEILDAALARVQSLGAAFLLVPGDLTKDGEKQDHLLMAHKLAALREKGIKAYVVPGNHDVLNPASYSYSSAGRTQVGNVTPSEFAAIYGDFGYREALRRDPGSLSYIAEPVPGLWLLAIDSASYSSNAGRPRPVTASGFTKERAAWVEEMLGEARREGKAVIAMLHHGIVEHFPGQAKYSGEYLVSDWRNAADSLAAGGVRLVFTGHSHAQDIALRKTARGQLIYDVETGSLASYPNPVRVVEIGSGGSPTIHSSFITDLPSFVARGESFRELSLRSLHSSIVSIAVKTMRTLGVRQADAATIAPQVADAFIASYRGDESFTGAQMLTTKGLGLMGRLVVAQRRGLVTGLWTDTPPADNDVTMDLGAGTWAAVTPSAVAAP